MSVVSLFREDSKGKVHKLDVPEKMFNNPSKSQKIALSGMTGRGFRKLKPGETVEIKDGKTTIKVTGKTEAQKVEHKPFVPNPVKTD